MILSFDKPAKIRPTEEHNNLYVADSAPPGTYVPNMSKEDMYRWKAKHIKGQDERIEIRKTIQGVQVLIIVYKHAVEGNWREGIQGHETIQISSNGKMQLTLQDWSEMQQAIIEARTIVGA